MHLPQLSQVAVGGADGGGRGTVFHKVQPAHLIAGQVFAHPDGGEDGQIPLPQTSPQAFQLLAGKQDAFRAFRWLIGRIVRAGLVGQSIPVIRDRVLSQKFRKRRRMRTFHASVLFAIRHAVGHAFFLLPMGD